MPMLGPELEPPFVRDLAEWHARTADIERDPELRAFHTRAAEALRELVRRGLAAQAAIDKLPTEDDRACLAAIHAAPDDRVRARLVRDYWHNGRRADRTPREWAYLHLGLLSGIIDRLLDAKGVSS